MSTAPKAVFLSYASQDADAASEICGALRGLGIEVWFDQNALRGGDAWDAAIRKQIRDCSLFVPVISASTQAREEGYFRLEWKLAVDRSATQSRRSSVWRRGQFSFGAQLAGDRPPAGQTGH